MSKLFTPAAVGPYRLSHRVVMAPLTRMRSDPGDIPSDLMVEYYTQRASDGGLIVSEARRAHRAERHLRVHVGQRSGGDVRLRDE